jgi:hypothetical protein
VAAVSAGGAFFVRQSYGIYLHHGSTDTLVVGTTGSRYYDWAGRHRASRRRRARF